MTVRVDGSVASVAGYGSGVWESACRMLALRGDWIPAFAGMRVRDDGCVVSIVCLRAGG
jgi:hypothetical protein